MRQNRMTLTDIARHLDVSRPTAYKIVDSVGFPARGDDARWDREAVQAWVDLNRAAGAAVVGGVIVRAAVV